MSIGGAVNTYHNLAVAGALILFALLGNGQTSRAESSNCAERANKQIPLFDSVTVFTARGEVVRGARAIVILPSASLLLTEQLTYTNVAIPFATIDSIKYQKPSPARWMIPTAGLVVGAFIGGAIGASAASKESSGFMDFPKLEGAMLGGVLGALLGAVTGAELSKTKSIMVTIRCK